MSFTIFFDREVNISKQKLTYSNVGHESISNFVKLMQTYEDLENELEEFEGVFERGEVEL